MKFLFFSLIFIVIIIFSMCNEDTDITNITPKIEDTISIDTTGIVIGYFYEAKKPFPQHVDYSDNIILPNISRDVMDQKAISYYNQWKSRYIKSFNENQKYVHYTREYQVGNAISCSEGHGFGMLITVLMAGNDSLSYDTYIKLYNFYKAHPSSINNKLMAWQQDENGNDSNGVDSATDGDLDIAFSLLLAEMQWGSNNDINFLEDALAMIEAIYESDINPDYKTIELGDWVSSGQKYYKGTRCCDFMLDHLRAFSNFSYKSEYIEVIDTVYNIVNTVAHTETGLFPDFAMIENDNYIPCPANFLEGPNDGDYYYNSCRAPWRIAMDYIVYGDDRALNTLTKLNNWIITSTGGNPSSIRGGYKLNGTPLNTWGDMAFTAPFGVSAMVDANNQEWLNDMWTEITQSSINDDSYFGNSIKMICIIVMSGNWWTPIP